MIQRFNLNLYHSRFRVNQENNTTVQQHEMLGLEGYNSGYNHGCSDAQQGGYPYLYGSGGASNHTTVFMQGYNDGWRNCTTSVESRSPSIEKQ